jgi:hypothetical protein
MESLRSPHSWALGTMESELSKFEILTIVIACISAFISLLAINGQRRLQREANDMQRATSALAQKQLEILEREDKENTQARVKLDLIKESKSNYKFYLSNISDQDARNVNLQLILANSSDDPIIKSDYKRKLPAKVISPGSSVSLIAALHLGSPTAYNAVVSWINPDGSETSYETYASL